MMSQNLIAPAVNFLVALALTLGAAASIQAQDASGAASAPPPWATEPAKPDHAKDILSDEALLRQHLAGGDSGASAAINSAQKTRPGPAATGAPGAPQGTRDQGSEVAKAVKDFVKPLNQEINNSSVVQAVREIDATVSGRAQAEGAEGSPSYGQRGNDATGNNQGSNKGNRKSDSTAAALMWEQFLDDVLPWAVGGLAAGLLGYGGYFWLKMIKRKNLKQGDKRRAIRRNRHSERHSAGRASTSVALVESALKEAAAPASTLNVSTASGGSGQASSNSSNSSRSSRSSSRRSSSRSSSRSSNGVSGGAAR
jgi:hypothetical protein